MNEVDPQRLVVDAVQQPVGAAACPVEPSEFTCERLALRGGGGAPDRVLALGTSGRDVVVSFDEHGGVALSSWSTTPELFRVSPDISTEH